jgi:adenosine deaminase
VSRDLRALPKAHLHVHLESTLRPSTVAALGGPAAAPLLDFAGFLTHNAAVRECLRRPADFTRVAAEFCEDADRDGVRYAEVTVTVAAHAARLGVAPAVVLDAVLAGLDGFPARVILDHSRRRPLSWAEATMDLAVRTPAVVAFGVAGDEAPLLAPYADLIAAVPALPMVHHAGETAGPESIREAVVLGRAVRIGHGIRALADPSVVELLRQRRIPLEVCPSSNVVLGLVPSFADHPLPALAAAGLTVTLNVDIPSVTGTTLTDEYGLVRSVFGWTDDQLADLARAGVRASFAPAAVKASLEAGISAWLR